MNNEEKSRTLTLMTNVKEDNEWTPVYVLVVFFDKFIPIRHSVIKDYARAEEAARLFKETEECKRESEIAQGRPNATNNSGEIVAVEYFDSEDKCKEYWFDLIDAFNSQY